MNGKFEHADEIVHDLSVINFRDGDRVDADLHFGCAVVVYKGEQQEEWKNPLESSFGDILKIGQAMVGNFVDEKAEDDPNWVTYRSFFTSLSLGMELDLSEQAKSHTPIHEDFQAEGRKASSEMPFVFGKFKKFNPRISQLKVYKGESEMVAEANAMKKQFDDFKEDANYVSNMPVLKQIIETTIYNIVPLAPYPETERCLGLHPGDSEMTIKEGYAVMAFDYEVVKAQEKCLFDLGTLLEKRKNAAGRYDSPQDVLSDNDVAANFLTKTVEGLVGLKQLAPQWKVPELDLYGVKVDPMNIANFKDQF